MCAKYTKLERKKCRLLHCPWIRYSQLGLKVRLKMIIGLAVCLCQSTVVSAHQQRRITSFSIFTWPYIVHIKWISAETLKCIQITQKCCVATAHSCRVFDSIEGSNRNKNIRHHLHYVLIWYIFFIFPIINEVRNRKKWTGEKMAHDLNNVQIIILCKNFPCAARIVFYC